MGADPPGAPSCGGVAGQTDTMCRSASPQQQRSYRPSWLCVIGDLRERGPRSINRGMYRPARGPGIGALLGAQTRSSDAAGNSGVSVMARFPALGEVEAIVRLYAGSRAHRGRHQRRLDASAAETALRAELDFGQSARFTGLEITAGLEQAAMVGHTRRDH